MYTSDRDSEMDFNLCNEAANMFRCTNALHLNDLFLISNLAF